MVELKGINIPGGDFLIGITFGDQRWCYSAVSAMVLALERAGDGDDEVKSDASIQKDEMKQLNASVGRFEPKKLSSWKKRKTGD